MLEDALAVAEAAVCGVECEHGTRLDAVHFDPLDRVSGLAAVGPDVLHGGRAGLSGDQREVLDAPQPALDRPLDQVVPFDARFGPYADPLSVVRDDSDAAGDRGQQHPVVVAGEEDVVAAAQDGPAFGYAAGEELPQVGRGLEFDEPLGPLCDAEAVAVAQVDMMKFSDHDVQS